MESVELSIVQKCADDQNRRDFSCEMFRICCNRWSELTIRNLGLEPGYYISSSYNLISMLNSPFDTTLGIHHDLFRLCIICVYNAILDNTINYYRYETFEEVTNTLNNLLYYLLKNCIIKKLHVVTFGFYLLPKII